MPIHHRLSRHPSIHRRSIRPTPARRLLLATPACLALLWSPGPSRARIDAAPSSIALPAAHDSRDADQGPCPYALAHAFADRDGLDCSLTLHLPLASRRSGLDQPPATATREPTHRPPSPTATLSPTVTPWPTVTPSPTATPDPDPAAPAAPIVIVRGPVDPADWVVDPLTVQDVRIADDRLTVRARHGGGCRGHDFYLVAAKTFMESNPVQSDVLLTHDAHGDLCRAIVAADLVFDLGPLKRAWEEAYGQSGGGTIILRIRGWDPPVTYTFPAAMPIIQRTAPVSSSS